MRQDFFHNLRSSCAIRFSEQCDIRIASHTNHQKVKNNMVSLGFLDHILTGPHLNTKKLVELFLKIQTKVEHLY